MREGGLVKMGWIEAVLVGKRAKRCKKVQKAAEKNAYLVVIEQTSLNPKQLKMRAIIFSGGYLSKVG